ncbi:hypothetical protein [Vibrio sp. B1FLJ16]|uniref:hypothetical protein n=1 Tax=Vibrio sp. B1FLJ16 TaxID=2751178 RepID=UPI0015F731B2|nr:hypothetical protein [Vibrio sp. B1FLJ16]CAD7797641.1 Tetratricopeptide repeat [Vibrio sp. B1FLJ16]CAE6881485.1 Tetratricopeptide repeat [Vibrio sp. B1FLJ16]
MRVLFYCGEFAPEGKTGAIRPSKLAKYFLKFGLNVSVITKETDNNVHQDLLKPLSEVDIERVKIRRFLPINDDGFWFFLYSFKLLVNKVKNLKPDYIFVSVPVFLPLISAAIVSKIFGVNLIIDYRDLWAADPYKPKSLKDRCLRGLGKIIEPWCMKSATIVSFISDNMRLDQEKMFGKINNAVVISTGFDSDDMNGLTYNPNDVSILFEPGVRYYSHIGMLDWDMNINELILFIKKYKSSMVSNVKFLFVGGKNELIKDAFKNESVADVCIFIDTVSKTEALLLTKISSGVIILGSDSAQRLNRKVFESIACNDNVFYFGNKKSPTAKVLMENNCSYVFDKSVDMEVVTSTFLKFLERNNNRTSIPVALNKYDKPDLAKQFIKLMEDSNEHHSHI